MQFSDFNASKDDDGRRLDRIARKFVSGKNLSEIYSLIRKGLIKINHKKAKPDSRVLEGDVVSFADFILENENQTEVTNCEAKNNKTKKNGFEELNIIFQNQHILVIDKPYDVAVHGSKDSLDKTVQSFYDSSVNKSSLSFKTGPLHRLDRKTSGLLCFSLSLEGAQWFTQNIKNHSIHKSYYALLEGKLEVSEHWEDLILKDGEKKDGFYTVNAVHDDFCDNSSENKGKNAISYVTPLAYGSFNGVTVTLAEVAIKTGRTHQIRSQAALHNHRLLGDSAYDSKIACVGRSFFLQAFKLEFPQNKLGLPPVMEIPLSPDYKKMLKSCGIDF